MDNIFNLVTGFQKSGVAIIRVSGFGILDILDHFMVDAHQITPRYAHFVRYADKADNGKFIDNGILIFFNAPNSFTGEEVIEFHIHGSIIIVEKFLSIIGNQKNYRLSQNGEFSKRALLNEKIDIIEAQGLMSIINAKTAFQADIGRMKLSGHISSFYKKWLSELIALCALVESNIDFSDQDIGSIDMKGIDSRIKAIKSNIINFHKHRELSYMAKDGLQISIIGNVNVGKSTIMNILSNSKVSIVSKYEGTTRDAISAELDIGGFLVKIFDTAGFRVSDNAVENIGIKLSIKKLKESYILVNVGDIDKCFNDNFANMSKLTKKKKIIFVINKFDRNSCLLITRAKKIIDEYIIYLHAMHNKKNVFSDKFNQEKKYIINKINYELLIDSYALNNILSTIIGHERSCICFVSAKNNHGISFIEEKVLDICKDIFSDFNPTVDNEYHKSLAKILIKSINAVKIADDLEILADKIRHVAEIISHILGKELSEEKILDKIFSSFCIGK